MWDLPLCEQPDLNDSSFIQLEPAVEYGLDTESGEPCVSELFCFLKYKISIQKGKYQRYGKNALGVKEKI